MLEPSQMELLGFSAAGHRQSRLRAWRRRLPAGWTFGAADWRRWFDPPTSGGLSASASGLTAERGPFRGADLYRQGLAEYTADHRVGTLCLRREREVLSTTMLHLLASQVAESWPMVVEAHRSLTAPRLTRAEFGVDHLRSNPNFLDPRYFRDELWRPAALTLGERLHRILLRLPPVLHRAQIPPAGLVERLAHFLEGIGDHMPLAIAVGEGDYLTPEYTRLLQRYQIPHVLSTGPKLPSLAEQVRCAGTHRELWLHLTADTPAPYATWRERRQAIAELLVTHGRERRTFIWVAAEGGRPAGLALDLLTEELGNRLPLPVAWG